MLAASNIGWNADDDEAILKKLNELGYKGLEIAPTRVFPTLPYEHPAEARLFSKKIEEDFGLTICSLQSIWYGRNESIFNNEDAKALISYTEDASAFAKAIGARNLVFGCPKNRCIPPGASEADAYDFLISCGHIAHQNDAVFALEANPPMYATNFMNNTLEVLQVLDALNHPEGLGVNLDLGTIITQEEPKETIEAALPYVSHIHISEPALAPIEHRELHKELRSILDDFGYCGYVSVEMSRVDYNTALRVFDYISGIFI